MSRFYKKKMEAKELRIGNLVYQPNRVGKVDEIWSNAVKLDGYNNAYDYDHTKPIPLTDEWLIMLGFIKDKTQIAVYYKGDLEIQLPNYFKYEDSHLRKLKYVHELQNLFFALTGTELELTTEL